MSPRRPGRPYRRSFTGAAAVSATAALALALGACSSTDGSGSGGGTDDAKGDGRPELKVTGAYVPQPPTDKMAGGFLTVRNGGATPDKLTSVSSDLAGEVEIHETVKQQMRQVTSLKVPANGTLELGRGGNHLMLMDLEHKPVKGDEVTFILHFEKSGSVTVKAPVEATNYTPKK